jgi:GntP family gluconate:H+ symporter
MDPMWILLIGVVIVVGGVLWLRLHAFLALIAGALVVGAMTPVTSVERYALEESGGEIVEIDRDEGFVRIRPAGKQSLRPGSVLLVYPRRGGGANEPLGQLEVERTDGAVLASISSAQAETFHVGDLVVEPTAAKAALARSKQTVGDRVAAGFGRTCENIGIMIALAAIIGDCLLASGGADRIVRTALKVVGEKRAPLAFLSSGYLLGIPVFFDTVFYLLIPLGKAMRLRTGHNYILYVLTIIAGATMTHSLVPPTPGPLAVARELHVDMGLMILGGMCVGFFTAAGGYFYAHWINARHDVPMRETSDISLEALEQLARRDESELPSTFMSLLPIVLPVVLIAGNTVADSLLGDASAGSLPAWQVQLREAITFFGDQNMALVIAAAISMLMLAWHKRASRDEMASTIGVALASGAVVMLITAAGGAFGSVLRESGIGSRIKELALAYEISGMGILVLAFLVTTLIRTAQGSSTVAMITAAGILGDTFAAEDLGFHPLYLALAIGCGSKPFSWMNDSGFWVICKMSGMTERETLRYLTPMTAMMGFIGCIVTIIGAWLWPLV